MLWNVLNKYQCPAWYRLSFIWCQVSSHAFLANIHLPWSSLITIDRYQNFSFTVLDNRRALVLYSTIKRISRFCSLNDSFGENFVLFARNGVIQLCLFIWTLQHVAPILTNLVNFSVIPLSVRTVLFMPMQGTVPYHYYPVPMNLCGFGIRYPVAWNSFTCRDRLSQQMIFPSHAIASAQIISSSA